MQNRLLQEIASLEGVESRPEQPLSQSLDSCFSFRVWMGMYGTAVMALFVGYLCIVSGQSPHQAMLYQRQLMEQLPFVDGVTLDQSRLSVWAVQPGIAGWPVLLSGTYDDPSVNRAYLVFEWTFPDLDDQSCTQSGRTMVLPCRGKAVEKTFDDPSSVGFNVTLTVSYPGAPAITTSIQIIVQSSFSGPVVTRREYRTLSQDEMDRIIRGFLELKNRGVWDHFTYIHNVSFISPLAPPSNTYTR